MIGEGGQGHMIYYFRDVSHIWVLYELSSTKVDQVDWGNA